MRTTITYRDGTTEEFEDAAPIVDPQEERTVSIIDADCGVVQDIELERVKRVVFDA